MQEVKVKLKVQGRSESWGKLERRLNRWRRDEEKKGHTYIARKITEVEDRVGEIEKGERNSEEWEGRLRNLFGVYIQYDKLLD